MRKKRNLGKELIQAMDDLKKYNEGKIALVTTRIEKTPPKKPRV